MLTFTHVMNLFAYELAGLRGWRFSGATVGSRAYGLERDGSDVDVRGVYLPPADLHWSLDGVPEQIEDPDADRVYWEYEKFVRLALKSNPNILEVLWTPLVNRMAAEGEQLREERRIFVSKQAYQTYGAYASSQFAKMERDLRTHGSVRFKHAMHCIRLLMAGVRLLELTEASTRSEKGEPVRGLIAVAQK